MRSIAMPSILRLLVCLPWLACDPGSGTTAAPKQPTVSSQGGTSGTSVQRNPLLDIPVDPPGEVNMTTPPQPGELDVFEQNRALGRGINIGNCLDAPIEGAWGLTLNQYMFQVIRDAGFDSIRLPVKWSNHAKAEAPYTIDPVFFARVDWAIAHAITRGLRIIVDIHHYGNTNEPGIYDQPAANHDRFLALWQQIAEHYQNYPKELYLEVLNEPRQALEPLWNQYLAEAVAIIRQSNPGRTLVVGGIWWNKWDALQKVDWAALNDNNIIATFHYYNPYCFTLQDGQTWEPACKPPTGDKATSGTPSWPVIYPKVDPNPTVTAAAQRAKLEQDMASAAAWSKAANRPLYMGEFGVALSSDQTARIDYSSSLARAAEKNGITWSYWEFASSMGIWNESKLDWDRAMLDALLPPPNHGAAGAAGTAGTAGTTFVGGAGAGGTSGNAGSLSGNAGVEAAVGHAGASGVADAGGSAGTAGEISFP